MCVCTRTHLCVPVRGNSGAGAGARALGCSLQGLGEQGEGLYSCKRDLGLNLWVSGGRRSCAPRLLGRDAGNTRWLRWDPKEGGLGALGEEGGGVPDS